ncbi:MAG: hypothetical protein U9P90_04325 [Patescibacteria group bacterium]|nr:hypothetical protein [Patescibacteria group bacterium]
MTVFIARLMFVRMVFAKTGKKMRDAQRTNFAVDTLDAWLKTTSPQLILMAMVGMTLSTTARITTILTKKTSTVMVGVMPATATQMGIFTFPTPAVALTATTSITWYILTQQSGAPMALMTIATDCMTLTTFAGGKQ